MRKKERERKKERKKERKREREKEQTTERTDRRRRNLVVRFFFRTFLSKLIQSWNYCAVVAVKCFFLYDLAIQTTAKKKENERGKRKRKKERKKEKGKRVKER